MDRTIFLIDMNSYFASVEQVTNPALRGKPIVVCGRGRTVVTTASYEARAWGVKTGMNLYEAKRLCPQVIPVCGNMDKYVDTSRRLHRIFLEFTDLVEPFSIDECFLDVTHLCRAGRDPEDIARQVKKRMMAETGLRCSIGIGPNKLISKLASKMQKPDGLVYIPTEEIPSRYGPLTVEELQGIGIGGKMAQKLRSLGIATARELGEAPIDLLTVNFGFIGYHLQRTGKGIDEARVKQYGEQDPVKSVGHSHTLPQDTWDMKVVKSFLLLLSEKVGVRLREAGMIGKTVSLVIRYGDFTSFGKQASLGRCIREGREIYATACGILDKLTPLPKAVRLVGVSIGNLLPDDGQQYLFEELERRHKLSGVIDEINKKYGEFTLKPSSLLIAEKFGIRESCGMVSKHRLKKARD